MDALPYFLEIYKQNNDIKIQKNVTNTYLIVVTHIRG